MTWKAVPTCMPNSASERSSAGEASPRIAPTWVAASKSFAVL